MNGEAPEQYGGRVAGMTVPEAYKELFFLWSRFSALDPQGQARIDFRSKKFKVFNENVTGEVSAYLESSSGVYSLKMGDFLTNGQKIRRDAEIAAGVRPSF